MIWDILKGYLITRGAVETKFFVNTDDLFHSPRSYKKNCNL